MSVGWGCAGPSRQSRRGGGQGMKGTGRRGAHGRRCHARRVFMP
ncbi:hypothetical protein RAA17_04595 [Komagataeibacter rhaeticus]|nr:hypothetical protein [Komagataeibacter rhaeticus]